MTGDPRRWASEPGTPGMVKFWGPYTYRSAFHAADDAEECERALAHLADVLMVEGAQQRRRHRARDGRRHERHPRAARRLPAGRPRPVRPARHRDDRRRGDGRVRPLRRVVRRRPLGRRARPHLLRQGRQLRLRAARWRDHQPAHRRHVRRPPVPGRADLLRPSAGVRIGRRQHQHLQGGGHHRARPPPRDRRHRARARRDGGAAPVDRRGPRPRRVLGDRAGQATARPASRSCRTTPPARPPRR